MNDFNIRMTDAKLVMFIFYSCQKIKVTGGGNRDHVIPSEQTSTPSIVLCANNPVPDSEWQ
jgi:hypothetical protein